MSPELKYLAFTAMLTAALWIPYVVSQVMTNGFLSARITSIRHRGRCRCGDTAPTGFT